MVPFFKNRFNIFEKKSPQKCLFPPEIPLPSQNAFSLLECFLQPKGGGAAALKQVSKKIKHAHLKSYQEFWDNFACYNSWNHHLILDMYHHWILEPTYTFVSFLSHHHSFWYMMYKLPSLTIHN